MKPRVLVVGGSLGGLFTAVLLQRAGFDITVTERSVHGLDGRGAGLVAQHEVFAVLREINLAHVAQISVVADQRIYLDRADRIIHQQAMPQPQISWDVLFRSVRAALPADRYQIGRRAVEVMQESEGARVVYEDGSAANADLVVGADGIGSSVRVAVSGAKSLPDYVGYAIWRGLVPEKRIPSFAGRQLFDRFSFYDAPGSQILGYLVPGSDGSIAQGQRRYNWVWYRRYTPAELVPLLTDAAGHRHLYSLAPGQVTAERVELLKADAAQLLPASFAAAVSAEPRPFIHAVYDYAPPRMVAGRVALVGDAAFVARPHTAMGVAKAAADALALRDSLVATPDVGEALKRYEAARAPVDRAIVAYGQRLGRSLAL